MNNVFISATTADLKKVRQHALEVALRNGWHPIVEEGFAAESNDVSAKRTIALTLRAADAVICLVGLHYGGEPVEKDRKTKRRSWTQMEYDVARSLGKKMLVCLAKPEFYRRGFPAESGSKREQTAKSRLQRLHYDSLNNGAGWFYPFSATGDVTDSVASFLKTISRENHAEKIGTKLLYCGAQAGTGGGSFQDLDLKGQLKSLKEAVRGKSVIVSSIFDASPLEIIGKINEVRPEILHVSGAQEAGCIKLHDKEGRLVPFDAEQLADLIADSNDGSLRLVVLDTCYSMQQAKRLTTRGIPYAIGIYDAISDDVATEFYSCFYNNIASGKNLEAAMRSASKLIYGHAKVDQKWCENLEDVLDMEFDARIHLPRVSVASGLNASWENL